MYGFGGLYMDSSWIIYVLPAILLAAFAQMRVSNAYNKYSRVTNGTGLTGAEIARTILDRNGLTDVRIERVSGKLSDHYDPRTKVIRLSSSIYSGNSVAAMSVAAHEVGHALQDADGYFPLILRNNMVPIVNISSQLIWVFILLGFLISEFFIQIGIVMFLAVVAFQIVTLPVEFNASRRALVELEKGISPVDKVSPAKDMLKAAALTYVAATLVAIGQLLRLLSMTNRRRR